MLAWKILCIQWNRNPLTSTSSEVSCHRERSCKNGKMKEISVSPTGKFQKNTRASIACKRSVFLSFRVGFSCSFRANLDKLKSRTVRDIKYSHKISSYLSVIRDDIAALSFWSHQRKYCFTSQIIVIYWIKSFFAFQ